MAFMSPLIDDPHPTCPRCRGIQCDEDTWCNICSKLSGDALMRYRALLVRRKKKKEQRRRNAVATAKPSSSSSNWSRDHALSSSPSPPHIYSAPVLDIVEFGGFEYVSPAHSAPPDLWGEVRRVLGNDAPVESVSSHGGDELQRSFHGFAPLQSALPHVGSNCKGPLI